MSVIYMILRVLYVRMGCFWDLFTAFCIDFGF